MALRHQDVPITREDVAGWLADYEGKIEPTKKMRDYLTAKLKERELDDAVVGTVENDSLQDETPLVDLILMDLPSYA